MTTCLDVITYALTMTRVVGSGQPIPADDEVNGLVAFQSFYDQHVNNGLFGRLADVYKTANYTAAENERVISPSAITVTFPTSVADCDNGGSRAPRDLSMIETILNGAREVKIYDRTGWVSLLGLTAASDAPLAARGAWALAAAFACSGAFGAMFGSSAQIGPDIRFLAGQFMLGLAYKQGTTRDRTPAEYF
jgi:hypothetical protein